MHAAFPTLSQPTVATMDSVTVYGLECKATGGFYVGQAEDMKKRLQGHASKPPTMLAKDLVPFDKRVGKTRLQWLTDQVVVHVLGMAEKGRKAHAMEKKYIKEKGGKRGGTRKVQAGICYHGQQKGDCTQGCNALRCNDAVRRYQMYCQHKTVRFCTNHADIQHH